MRDMNKIKRTNVYWVEILDNSSKTTTKELFVRKASIFSFKGIKMLFKLYVLNKFRPDSERRSYFEEVQ